MDRRDFLKVSAATSAVLATGSSLALLSGCSSNTAPATGYRYFRSQDVTLLTPLIKTVLGPALTAANATAEDGMKAFDNMLDGAMPGTRDTLFELLDLLQISAARRFVIGSWAAFNEQSDEERATTVEAWATRSYELSRMAYKGLIQPIHIAWYTQATAGLSTGYPGPPTLAAR